MTKAKLEYVQTTVIDIETGIDIVNGIPAYEVPREHAIYREFIRAIYRGELDDYCKKYSITYDDVYLTQIEAIVEFIEQYTYLGIDVNAPVAKA